jgi:hypothetical protein
MHYQEKEGFSEYNFLFPDRYLGLLPPENYNKKSLHLLCGVLDQSKEGRISFSEFQTFEGKTGGERESKWDTGQVTSVPCSGSGSALI